MPTAETPEQGVPVPDPEPARAKRAPVTLEKVEAGGLRLGRWVRVLAGVDEKLLAKVPQERARYTGLGGVVLGTASIAAFSMWFAITQLLGYGHPLVAVPVLIWFLFILSFDRWLVSSALGTGWRRRLPTLLMRVLMAVFFGVIIAEPLVLRIFQTAIEQHIRDERQQELADLRSKLLTCNPQTAVPGGEAPPGCSGYMMSFQTTPGSTIAELAARRADAQTLQTQMDADQKELSRINDLARRECVGDSGEGLSGRFGVGPNCRRLRTEADTFAATHPVAPNLARMTDLQNQINQLTAQVSTAQADFEQARATMIDARVAELRSHQGPIGLLERMAALKELAATNLALGSAVWAVRLFFILVDCMPVLVKFLGGNTTYDRLVDVQLAHARSLHRTELGTESDEADAGARRRRAQLDLEVQEHAAEMNIRLGDAVHDLATRLDRR